MDLTLEKNDIRLFVYGTLKKGYSNHFFLENCKYLGKAISVDQNFQMYEWEWDFPIVSQTNEGYFIKGEIYEVPYDQINAIDILEDHPNWYQRKKRYFILENSNEVISAWIYLQDYQNNQPKSEPNKDKMLEWFEK
jgi:gamma-glutamylaminecyclotransferase